ncbi:MAG: DUF3604 domain-containing protein [Lentisphaeria bacterium]|nr:DUF3604 domain-containing protein [Lentisphaeria bacterium]
MHHLEKKNARSVDMPGRCREFTDMVYSGAQPDPKQYRQKLRAVPDKFAPPPMEYSLFCGEMHGHTNLSDGLPDIDDYFRTIRDRAKFDFGALTDHDHGGVGKDPLWAGGKWEKIQAKVREYYEPGKFTTLLAYERDSYPYFNNLVIYYRSGTGELFRGVRDGEITGAELSALLKREDILVVPHDSYRLSAGCDFLTLPPELMPPLLEIYSCSDCAEYFDHPLHKDTWVRGGSWQDALQRGAKMGVVGGSDDHAGTPGLDHPDADVMRRFRGVTGVWAKENTREAIFDALKARRCFAYMGNERMSLDFRINGHCMGESFVLEPGETRNIWIDFRAPEAIERVTLVKNCRDMVILYGQGKQLLFDYRQETPCDCYYIRAITEKGRYCWSSPIWIAAKAE